MAVYSALLLLGLVGAAPWWLWRMATSGRYRAGLGQRLGRGTGTVSRELDGAPVDAGAGARGVVWVHAVSVGEVLACERLVRELGATRFRVVVSTTTATGQRVARERLRVPVFYFPLDFAFAVRAWLRALRPEMMVLVESELWPRLLRECESAGVPVAVVNARVSDRSFERAMKVRRLWGWMGRRVAFFLAQGEESAERLRALGAERVRVTGNLKYDAKAPGANAVAEWVRGVAGGRPVVVAGSTLGRVQDGGLSEEEMVIQAWEGELRSKGVLLVLAARHPERFAEVEAVACEFRLLKASERGEGAGVEIVLIDTLGDLAAVYGMATAAFVGGSLVSRGGHNPLEAARFGVPVVMGESYENFREMVEGMRKAGAIRIVKQEELGRALRDLLRDGREMGEQGQRYFEQQAGATGRTMAALLELVGGVR